jgi:NAD(P)-dependent dehydrogenase (short-subunit alcohol dehydrogenase family)
MDLHLAGKAAVVTGASKGIGLAVARALAAEGARVTAGARHFGELPDGVRAVGAYGRLDLLVGTL